MADRCKHEMLVGTCSICLGLEDVVAHIPISHDRAAELFDYAASKPEWTKHMAMGHFGWSAHVLGEAIRTLRKLLAGDQINLVVEPHGCDWVYKLVGDLEGAMPWCAVRLRSVESQLNTLDDVVQSIVNGTKAGSRDGKRARVIAAQINILHLQLANID